MKIYKKISLIMVFVMMFTSVTLLTGCTASQTKPDGVYIMSIEKSSSSDENEYSIIYSDGTISKITLRDGRDGTNGTNGKDGKDGTNGIDGKDGKDLSIQDIYSEYKNQYPDSQITFAEFLETYLSYSDEKNILATNSALRSVLKVYSEYYVTQRTFFGETKGVSMSAGTAVIYKITDEYTYLLSNYHVVYESAANSDNGGKIARRIVGYVYGTNGGPVSTGTKDGDYDVYNFSEGGLNIEFVGGAITYDLSLLRVKTEDLKKVNPNAAEVKFASEYHTGQTAIAIGNPENEGISATQGIISVDSENIVLSIDGTQRAYRSIRIDTPLYSGNSGGGLFNLDGELIGITNAGDGDDQNVNYAIPLSIVKNVAENLMRNCVNTDETSVKKPLLGVTVESKNARYVYDSASGLGYVKEDIVVTDISDNSIAKKLGFTAGDIIEEIVINGTSHVVNRSYEIGDLLLTIKSGDTISVKCLRGQEKISTNSYTFISSDLKSVD